MLLSAAALAAEKKKPTIDSATLDPPKKTEEAAEYDAAVLRSLNKVTAKSQAFDTPVGTTIRFGTLEVAVHRCWKSRPEERPENAALLEVTELKPGESPQRVFLGWMFSSSPGLSGLEHPVYDVTLIACETKKEPVNH